MMKTLIFKLFPLLVMLFSLTACGNQDKKKSHTTDENVARTSEVSPEVLLENEYAQVVKVTLAPGESLAAHDGKKRVIYSISDYTIDWVEGEEPKETRSWSKGDVHFHNAGEHSATNTGKTTAEWLAFINKGVELPDCDENTIDNDVNKVAPEFAKLIFDDSGFRITEVNVPKGEKIPMHAGINRIIYSLTDYDIEYDSGTDGSVKKTFSQGDAHWHDACKHALENTGQTEAKFLVVGYK